MKKKNDTQMAFLDLMLCAIGCALMIFTAQVPQPRGRGRGWDDRPLVVRAWATGPLNSQYRWELTREAAKGGGPNASGVTATPADRTTRSGQPVLFVAPEAEFGAWKLTVAPRAEPSGLESLARDLQTANVFRERPTREVQTHLDFYDRYLTMLEGRPQAADLDEYLKAVRDAPAPKVGDVTGFNLTLSQRIDVETYLKYRRLVMQAALRARIDPARSHPDSMRIEKEIAALLSGAGGKPNDKRRLGVLMGIRVEEELRLSKEPGAACAALDATLAEHARFSDEEVAQNACYACYLGEYIRARAIQEHLAPEAKIRASTYRIRTPNYQPNLRATARLGVNDLLFRVIAHEISALGRTDRAIEVRFGVIWGDKHWPAPPPGQGDDKEGLTEKVQIAPGDVWSIVPLATITLPKDGDRPSVATELR